MLLIGLRILSLKGGVLSKLAACLLRHHQGRRAGPASLEGARELTAEQLVGAINNNAATMGGNAGRTRRTRRPRRTPSQILTTLPPAYNKEPGGLSFSGWSFLLSVFLLLNVYLSSVVGMQRMSRCQRPLSCLRWTKTRNEIA